MATVNWNPSQPLSSKAINPFLSDAIADYLDRNNGVKPDLPDYLTGKYPWNQTKPVTMQQAIQSAIKKPIFDNE